MGGKAIFFIITLILFSIPMNAQHDFTFDNSFVESTSNQEKFQIYIDTIRKYMYRDSRVVEQGIQHCEDLFHNGFIPANSDKLDYYIQLVYHELNNKDVLKSYQLLKDHEHLLSDETISSTLKENFIYIQGYTYMTLGDLDLAQKTFYGIINRANLEKDTSNLIQGLYSLGQLYSDEKDYNSAIKTFSKIVALKKHFKISVTTEALLGYELSEAYRNNGNIDLAIEIIDTALIFMDKNNLEVLKPDLIYLKARIIFDQGNLSLAKDLHAIGSKIASATQDPASLENSRLFEAKLLEVQEKYDASLQIYKALIAENEKDTSTFLLELYQEIQEVYNKKGDPKLAYQYLSKSFALQEQLTELKEQQQTSYLKIKFDLEQKEKENQVLAAKFNQEQSQNKILFITMIAILLGLLTLFVAFYQKRKYNRRLKGEVKRRTLELEKSNIELAASNRELDEFNRILSHDLKEPLRSIVGFSALIQKENASLETIQEYIGFIEKSGRQLHYIIEDVSIYQNIGKTKFEHSSNIELKSFFEKIIQEIRQDLPEKKIQLFNSHIPLSIHSNRTFLKLVFKNLLENAVKYNQNELAKIEIRYRFENEKHYFELKDNGIGIAPQFHEQIFGMFKRLNTRLDYEGTGLGLSLAKKVITKIGGNIRVLQSAENMGSTFEVSFPFVVQAPEKLLADHYQN